MGKLQKIAYYQITSSNEIKNHLINLMKKNVITQESILNEHKHVLLLLCVHGHMSVIQWLLNKPDEPKICHEDIIVDRCFQGALMSGHLDMAKYLLQLKNINIYAGDTLSYACRQNHMNIVQWLLSLRTHPNHIDDWNEIDIHSYNDIVFQEACSSGNIEIPKLLMSMEDELGEFNIHCYSDAPFVYACSKGKGSIPIAEWLISMEEERGVIDVHVGFEYVITSACYDGNLPMLKWLLTLEETHGQFDIHVHDRDASYTGDYTPDVAYRWAKDMGHDHVCEWLKSLEPTHGRLQINE